MPRIPKAASSALIARTSGTTAATIAPNANSRMKNVSGIVSRSESSSPVEMRALMSSLRNGLLIAWIVRSGCAARAASTIGRTGAMSGVTRASSPEMRATIRTVVPSADTSPASGGASSGLGNGSKVVVVTPSSGALAARSLPTRSPTAAWKAGFVVAPGPPLMTTMTCWYGSFVPPALKTS